MAEITVVFIAGMSGAGRSAAADVFEDEGWYVADNVPVSLIGKLVELARTGGDQTSRLAMVVRGADEHFGTELAQLRADLESDGASVWQVFLDASDDALVRRFEQVRRRHPLQTDDTLVEAIGREREYLSGVKAQSDLVIDTSSLSVARLREVLANASEDTEHPASLSVSIQSFGFKYGVPIDSDLVTDVRFLPNPYWEPELRALNGTDAPVRDYVLSQEGADEFARLYADIIRLVADGYLREGKRYMSVGIGCTGGKHRSVAMVQELARRLAEGGDDDPTFDVRVMHRDLGRE
ncbi:RNase adapter RapZ [Gordonia crocea]|uniref:Nucleotide-binding protein n=1 Tax=Gordonia crocea TaxID=589162 RepID=A0A7I9UYB7_9ACTN|nr:RNase adapter RapZ [Gordonia crocea]GED97922.1 nucleotide-binding protein [Gordonia crocea]